MSSQVTMQTQIKEVFTLQNIILFGVALLIVLLCSTTTSPLFEGWRFWYGGDSAVFQEMGYCIIYGKTPYIDFFDHKGPLLFLINGLGLMISKKWGICALQTISLTVSFLFCDKTARLFLTKSSHIQYCLLLFAFVLFSYYHRGNTSEEWCLPFLMASFFQFFKQQQTNTQLTKKNFISFGLCIGCIFLIRANSSSPIIGLLIYYFYIQIKNKEFDGLLRNLGHLLLGISIVIAAAIIGFLLFYGMAGTIEMLIGTFIFNFEYFFTSVGEPSLLQIIKYILPIVLFIAVTITNYTMNVAKVDNLPHKAIPSPFRIDKPIYTRFNVNVSLFFAYFVTLLSCGTKCLEHYVIIYLPLFLISVCSCNFSTTRMVYYIHCLIIIVCITTAKPFVDCIMARMKNEKSQQNFSDSFHNFVVQLTDNEKKSIYNYHGKVPVYNFVNEQLLQCSRIAFPTHLTVSPRMVQYESLHGISEIQPEWILIANPDDVFGENKQYIQDNYVLSDSIYDINMMVYCYKKKHYDY